MRWGRCILLVLCVSGLPAVVSPQQTDPDLQAERPAKVQQALPAVALPPKEDSVEAAGYKKPCRNTGEDRQSDLCAQWSAADAASDAAWWAMFGTIVAILGTLGLWVQIHLTRKAVEDTSEATEAMREANRLTREAQTHDLRPYLFIDRIEVDPVEKFDGKFRQLEITVFLKNFGRLPARDIRVLADCYKNDDLAVLSTNVLKARPIYIPFCAAGHERTVHETLMISSSEFEQLATGFFEVVLRYRWSYRRAARKRYWERADYIYERRNGKPGGKVFVLSAASRMARDAYRSRIRDMLAELPLEPDEEEENDDRPF